MGERGRAGGRVSLKTLGDRLVVEVSKAVQGKHHEVRLTLACLFAGGHLLIEDLPGMGKTTLSHALAAALGLQFSRIQFTSDLLPADILGASIFDPSSRGFQFHPGPLFAQLVLADEINRASAKTQSALLECMEEGQATVDGASHRLPTPFFVIATQNPIEQSGTHRLPESQLDRFLMRIQLGYPPVQVERRMLAEPQVRGQESVQPCIDAAELEAARSTVDRVQASDALLDYVLALIDLSRSAGHFVTGLSPRGGLSLMGAARSWAALSGRDFLLPEDIQTVLPAVADHRLQWKDTSRQPATPSAFLQAKVDALGFG